MGKSGGKRKKGVGGNKAVAAGTDSQKPISNGGVDVELDSVIFLKRAHELKEEGNKRFQSKDYVAALEQYENAIKLIPRTHPDRAVFHSNKAACLMQMRPIDYEAVISECSLALHAQPRFARALLRRARAYEAMGRYDMALQDVQDLLKSDPNHGDALEIAKRLRMALGPRQDAQQDLHSRPSPAALGASAVRGAPIAGLGPCLPARPVTKKSSATGTSSNVPAISKTDKAESVPASENSASGRSQPSKVALKLSNGSSKTNDFSKPNGSKQLPSLSSSGHGQAEEAAIIQWRQLKLVYDHDIRLAQMPLNCSFKVLREIVKTRFPSSNSVLIKYKDNDSDLVTITCNSELRMAEASVDSLLHKDPSVNQTVSVGMLRLHVVEVSPEQEPPLLEEEEEEEEKPLENVDAKDDETISHSSPRESTLESVEAEVVDKVNESQNEKADASEDVGCKEMEMDDWLFEFAQLFRTHVGIDPDAHVDLHEVGMELCSVALEETVTSEEAQVLFDKAALKFQEVAALAFFNWGNVHMCAARKKIPMDDSAPEDVKGAQLGVAYEWVKERYAWAKEKYEEALVIKPDFYEGLLALGQQQFEMAKLHWSYALAKKEDLASWDSTETMRLFDDAEEKMQAATDMWEKLEEKRMNDLKEPNSSKVEELLKKKTKQAGDESLGREPTADEVAEQATLMRSQIHLFWGNMLFERSQIEYRLGQDRWKKDLDLGVERFKLAGASETDISTVLNNHCSKVDGNEDDVKKTSDTLLQVNDN